MRPRCTGRTWFPGALPSTNPKSMCTMWPSESSITFPLCRSLMLSRYETTEYLRIRIHKKKKSDSVVCCCRTRAPIPSHPHRNGGFASAWMLVSPGFGAQQRSKQPCNNRQHMTSRDRCRSVKTRVCLTARSGTRDSVPRRQPSNRPRHVIVPHLLGGAVLTPPESTRIFAAPP